VEDRLIHSVALRFANWVTRYDPKEDKDFLKLVYGTEVMIINISKLAIVIAIALWLGVLPHTIALLAGFNVIRRYAFGLHATNGTVCTAVSVIMFIGVPYLLKDMMISSLTALCIFGFILLSLYLYAPADTESRPLVGEKKRARLKKRAVISGLLLMSVVLLLPDGGIKTMLILGAVYETVSILPLSYKILKRRMNNYDKFERTD